MSLLRRLWEAFLLWREERALDREMKKWPPLILPSAECKHRYIQVRHTWSNEVRPDGTRARIDEVICADCGKTVEGIGLRVQLEELGRKVE